MVNYLLRRLILIPITLFGIILVNFIIINLAPGDPVTIAEITQEGTAARREDRSVAFGRDDRYLQFREFYGLTLPILWNAWPFLSKDEILETLKKLTYDRDKMTVKKYDEIRIKFGDQSRFIMGKLFDIVKDERIDKNLREMGVRFMIRGGTRQGYVGAQLSEEQKKWNRIVAQKNDQLDQIAKMEDLNHQVEALENWMASADEIYELTPTGIEKIEIFFFETRFFKYMSRVLTLDFGTMRNDPNKTVLYEVTRRFKYSLTLAVIPMLITFFLCQFFGIFMAYTFTKWPDLLMNLLFLVLYALPIFVVAPFLIEKVALNNTFPFTDIPIPISGFSSPEPIYSQLTTFEKIVNILQHLALPFIAVMYGSLAVQSRLSRTAFLEVLRQDYIRTAKAKGVSPAMILIKHAGRNAAITIVTSLAGSLGIILGGSLIVETLFGINGFGKFFYDAVINRDYNVMMFSVFAGAFLTLMGYLAADIAYTILDPRVTLD